MGKTVYSLVLSEEVVAAVDALASRQGYSRSAMVNHILADYADVTSPQRQARQVLDALESAAGEKGLRRSAGTAGSLTLRTALCYKYNPALSYTVELWEAPEYMGQLRVALRSQSDGLLDYFRDFFELWYTLERRHLVHPQAERPAKMEQKRWLRSLRRPQGAPVGKDAGLVVAAYVALLDDCMKAFFGNLADNGWAAQETERLYLAGLEKEKDLAGL